jgi:hypothetical protein
MFGSSSARFSGVRGRWVKQQIAVVAWLALRGRGWTA